MPPRTVGNIQARMKPSNPAHQGHKGLRMTAVAATVAGLFAVTALVAYVDFGSVIAAIRPIGLFGFLSVALAQALLCVPLGCAWWTVARDQPLSRIGVFAWASLVAEAAAAVLPFSQVGGAAIASRAATVAGVKGRIALASNIVDITMELAAQLVFTLCGAAYLGYRLHVASGLPVLRAAALWGIGVVVLLLIALLAAQKWGLGILELVMRRLAPDGPDPAAVTKAVKAVYRRPRRLAACLGLHLLAWIAGVAGAWLILQFIGWPRPFFRVAAMESLLLAVRNAAFVVPAGLGVQEGAYVLLGPLFGLPPSVALALSLLKRGRDIAIGVPVLLSWQALEIRRPLRHRYGPAAPTPPPPPPVLP
jgi:putative membrane protein